VLPLIPQTPLNPNNNKIKCASQPKAFPGLFFFLFFFLLLSSQVSPQSFTSIFFIIIIIITNNLDKKYKIRETKENAHSLCCYY